MRNSSSLDWLRFMHTPNDYRVSPKECFDMLIFAMYQKQKNPCKVLIYRDFLRFAILSSGETGIRTPGTSQYNGFQDRRNRPLCHLSKTPLRSTFFLKAVQRYAFILKLQIVRYFFCQKNFKSYFCIQITNVSKKELKHDISSEL